MATDPPLVRLTAALVGRQEELATEVVRVAREEILALDQDAAGWAQLAASVAENIVAGVHYVSGHVAPEDLEAPSAALSYARSLAQRDVPLSALVRAYRLGHARVLDAVFEQLESLPEEERVATVVEIVRSSQRYIDRIVEQVGHAYEVERERWVASRSGVRQQWVNDLLAGGSVDVTEASEALDYPLAATHVALRVWPHTNLAGPEAGTAVSDARQAIVRLLGARASLLVPVDEREVRIWCAVPSGAPVRLTAPPDARVHVAYSGRAAGVAGFRRTAVQADRVHAVVSSDTTRIRWLGYDDVAPVALLAGDLPALRELVLATLGDLAAPDSRAAMLRETLRTFLQQQRSFAATGQQLSLHRNSVQYRVQQAQALLPSAVPDDLQLRLALDCAHHLGDVVLAGT